LAARRPGVLRIPDGHTSCAHQAGEPYLQSDEHGQYVLCLKCETSVRWQDEDPAVDVDLDDDTALA